MSTGLSSASCSSIEDKIELARTLFEHWEEALRNHPRIGDLLDELNGKTAASQEAMHDLGVVAACRHCDEQEGGSCCGAGVEDKYTPVLLLINLLLQQTLPEQRLCAKSCYFLGNSGCMLRARQVLCVNYLCLRIQHMLPQQDLVRLQNITGEELDTLFLLHETIKRFIGR